MGRSVKESELQRQITRVVGKHIYANMYGLQDRHMVDVELLTKIVIESAKIGNMHIIELITKKFNGYNGFPGGVSVIALIEESHIALHTWPESNYITLDIYSCGEKSNPEVSYKYILEKLKPKRHKYFSADRSNSTLFKD